MVVLKAAYTSERAGLTPNGRSEWPFVDLNSLRLQLHMIACWEGLLSCIDWTRARVSDNEWI